MNEELLNNSWVLCTGLIYLYIEFNPLGDKYFYHIFSDEKIETQAS